MKLGKETQKEKVFLNLETFDEDVRAVLMKKNELGETNENRGKLILHGEFAETETNRRRVKDCRLKIVIPQNFEKFTIHIKKHVTAMLNLFYFKVIARLPFVLYYFVSVNYRVRWISVNVDI